VILLSFLLVGSACEFGTTVSVDTTVPPNFRLWGSGHITMLSIREVAKENQAKAPIDQDLAKNTLLWWIRTSHPIDKPMWSLAPITYGRLPEGFYQKEPVSGSPPALVEGKVYDVWVVASGAAAGGARFTIRDGKSVQLEIGRR
jgi:hypothetical protein